MSIYYGITLCDRHRDIDLKKLKEYGFKIAYIEVTNGYTVSELLYDHYENAKRSGLKIGYIHTLDCKLIFSSGHCEGWNATYALRQMHFVAPCPLLKNVLALTAILAIFQV